MLAAPIDFYTRKYNISLEKEHKLKETEELWYYFAKYSKYFDKNNYYYCLYIFVVNKKENVLLVNFEKVMVESLCITIGKS